MDRKGSLDPERGQVSRIREIAEKTIEASGGSLGESNQDKKGGGAIAHLLSNKTVTRVVVNHRSLRRDRPTVWIWTEDDNRFGQDAWNSVQLFYKKYLEPSGEALWCELQEKLQRFCSDNNIPFKLISPRALVPRV